jgi:hypothetical protein
MAAPTPDHEDGKLRNLRHPGAARMSDWSGTLARSLEAYRSGVESMAQRISFEDMVCSWYQLPHRRQGTPRATSQRADYSVAEREEQWTQQWGLRPRPN